MRKLSVLILLPLFLSCLCGQARAADYPSMKVRIACSTPKGTSIQAVPLEKMIEIVERESGGKIKCEFFPGGVLDDEQTVVKQLRGNEIQIGVLAAGNLTPFAPRATLLILPYMFPTRENACTLFSDAPFMQELNNAIAQQSNTRPLAWLIGGYRVLTNSKKPIRSMADMQGLKLRVPPVKLQLEAFRSWGVEPHPLSWSETFNGLQQGVIDGQENPHQINRDTKFWEVQKYISDIHYMLWVAPILVSERWYARLAPQTRALFDRAAREAARYEWQWAAEDESKALRACLDNGMTIDAVTDEELWKEKARAVWPAYYEAVGGKDRIDKALTIMGE